MDFPLGAAFSAIFILAALAFAYPNNLHLWVINGIIIFACTVLVIVLCAYACMRTKFNRKHSSKDPVDEDICQRKADEPDIISARKTDNCGNTTTNNDNYNRYEVGVWSFAKECLEFIRHFDGLITSIATVFLTVITGVLVWVAYLQWQTSKEDQRPWVGMTAIQPETENPISRTALYHKIIITNSGKSPAFHVMVGAGEWNKDPHSMTFPTKKCDEDCVGRSIEILPGTGLTFEFPSPDISPPPQVSDIVWVVLRIDYEDSDGAPHKTGLCVKIKTRLVASAITGQRVIIGTQVPCGIRASEYVD